MDKARTLQAALGELQNFKFFEGLAINEIAEICYGGRIIVNHHKQSLYVAGEAARGFGIVLSGAYKLSRPNPLGDETIVHFATPGDFVGLVIMSQLNSLYPVSSFAMGPSRFLEIPRTTFTEKWASRPDLIIKIQGLLSGRIHNLHVQKALTKAPLAAKIANLLLEILNKYEGNEAQLPVPLTRREIAENLGVSVEAVIRVMSDWSKLGIIETRDQQIRILKMDKIIQEINSSLLGG